MNIKKTTEGIEVITFSTTADMKKSINKIKFIKVVKDEYVAEYESYIFTLENGDSIAVDKWEYNLIQLHESAEGVLYKPVLVEHEDSESDVEYIGFQLN